MKHLKSLEVLGVCVVPLIVVAKKQEDVLMDVQLYFKPDYGALMVIVPPIALVITVHSLKKQRHLFNY